MPFLIATLLLAITSPLAFAEDSAGFLSLSVSANNKKYTTELPLLDSPHGTITGSITLSGQDAWVSLEKMTLHNLAVATSHNDLWPLYQAETLKYYEVKDGHTRVLANTAKGEHWLKLGKTTTSEGVSIDLSAIKWTSQLHGTLWQISGYHNYRLRDAPSTKGKVLVRLNENRHIIKQGTGKIDGHWAEVIVLEATHVPHDQCYSSIAEIRQYLTGKEWKGWIKVLGDNGEPNDITDAGIC